MGRAEPGSRSATDLASPELPIEGTRYDHSIPHGGQTARLHQPTVCALAGVAERRKSSSYLSGFATIESPWLAPESACKPGWVGVQREQPIVDRNMRSQRITSACSDRKLRIRLFGREDHVILDRVLPIDIGERVLG